MPDDIDLTRLRERIERHTMPEGRKLRKQLERNAHYERERAERAERGESAEVIEFPTKRAER